MRHKLCRSFHPWCPGVKNRCLYCICYDLIDFSGLTRSLWVGILIALPSGAGVALSILGGNAGSLVGVAISASLLPPAVNAVCLFFLFCDLMCNKLNLRPGLLRNVACFKSMLVNKNFQSWLLIGWQHSCQPIRSHVCKSLLRWVSGWVSARKTQLHCYCTGVTSFLH